MLSLSSTFKGLEAFAIYAILIFYYSMQMLEIKLFQTKWLQNKIVLLEQKMLVIGAWIG